MDSDPGTTTETTGDPHDDTNATNADSGGVIDVAAELAARTAERDRALTDARQAQQQRDDAVEQAEQLREEIARLRLLLAGHPRCAALTPIYASPCRWPAGHTGSHQTLGGWMWTT